MQSERQQLEAGITALEAQRSLLGAAVVDAMLAPARARLAALDEADGLAPVQSLKQVAILFLDVVGSTTLSQHLDPQAVSAVMDDALKRGTAIVETHRGHVLQYAGDNLLAGFGVDEAREDDSERAVRCGVALLQLGRAIGAEVLAAHRHEGFDVRIGIHTGGVLLGGGVDADGTIRGIAVNIAARMEQTAPAGGLRISHDTYAQVRGLFEVEAQEPLAIKGVDEPVQSYLVIKAKPRSFRIGTRGIEGVTTRMIGRDAEFETLQEAFKRLFVERTLAAVTVTADAGVGKSRLLYEFAAWSEARPEAFFIFRGRASPQTQGQPFGLLRDILAWRFQIADDDTIEAARTKMEDGIVPLFVHDDGPDLAEAHAHLLGHLIGIEWKDSRHIRGILDDPRQIRNRAFHAAAQLFRRVSATEGYPLVLQLEDLHWADDESLDFLAYLAEIDHDVPFLILAFARPTLFERRANWCSDDVHRRIELAPLDKRASRDLANELLKKLTEVPAALRELITGGAEGNPFYMEELVKMLIDQKAILTGDVWRVDAERLLVTHVPATLTGVLQARLDQLPAAERLTLQEASVIGQVFWDQALIALNEDAATTLPALVTRELALPGADRASDDHAGDDLREYVFKHAILHQVTYATVLKRVKKELHGKLAHWMAAQTGLRANDFLGIAAEHYEEAGDAANAAEFHARAAERASTSMAHDAVMRHVQRALALIENDGLPIDPRPLRWRVLVVREASLDLQGKRPEQKADLDAMGRVADALDDDHHRAHAAWRRSVLGQRTADWPAMATAAIAAIHHARAAGDDRLRLQAQRSLCQAQVNSGDLLRAQLLTEQTLAEARALGLRQIEGECLNTLTIIAHLKNEPVASLDLNREALIAHQAAGNRRGEAINRSNAGVFWATLGNLKQARLDLEEGLRMHRAHGDRFTECSSLTSLSELAHWQSDDPRALSLARSALDLAISVQARDKEQAALLFLGDAELALGRHSAATRAFERGLALAIDLKDPRRHDMEAGLARVALACGDATAALAAIEPLMALAAQASDDETWLEGTNGRRRIELTCYQVLARAGDPRATPWLRRTHAALQRDAARITDPVLRQGFLQNIPPHRDIVAAWSAVIG